MDITRYSPDIQALYEEHARFLSEFDMRNFDVLEQLKERALEMDDKELLGFCYHSLAFAEYFMRGDYAAYLKDLRAAADVLFDCEDKGAVSSVFYLIAVDAINKGMYDLAYHNLQQAYDIDIEQGKDAPAAVLLDNMGGVLNKIGAYEAALEAFEPAHRGIEQDSSHAHYYNNVVSCRLNIVYANFGLGRVDAAQENFDWVRDFVDANVDKLKAETRVDYMLVSTRMAVHQGQFEHVSRDIQEISELFDHVAQPAAYIPSACKLIDELMEAQAFESAQQLIDIISKRRLPDDAYDVQCMIIRAKIAYYKATNRHDELLESYLEQDRILERGRTKKAQESHYARELINIANELYIQQSGLQRKSEEIVKNAGTDALTGLANRHAADHVLIEAFERAYAEQQRIGLCIIDLDGLKICNDLYGHQAGDRLLVEMADALAFLMRDSRVFCSRYGGDEFLLICEGMTDDEIKEALAGLYQHTQVEFSAGVCNVVPRPKMRTWDMLQAADRELYKVKDRKKASAAASETPAVKTQDIRDDLSICSQLLGLSERDRAGGLNEGDRAGGLNERESST
ncbi:MAG: GGDEF domain-containing protein [Atopobiaceae bacterium]|nr:GGDEF domain-containing protein [Atopobiaceae bacterium]